MIQNLQIIIPFFFFNDTATTEIYTLSLHDALPIWMVIAPCSIRTAAAIASCHSDTLVSRAADVTLKEGRPLILVVRETPLHLGHLRVLTALAEMGVVILPPMPAFYNRPKDLDDIVNHTVARVLDRLNLPQSLVAEWQGTAQRAAQERLEAPAERLEAPRERLGE